VQSPHDPELARRLHKQAYGAQPSTFRASRIRSGEPSAAMRIIEGKRS
jgi:hypothetical protein